MPIHQSNQGAINPAYINAEFVPVGYQLSWTPVSGTIEKVAEPSRYRLRFNFGFAITQQAAPNNLLSSDCVHFPLYSPSPVTYPIVTIVVTFQAPSTYIHDVVFDADTVFVPPTLNGNPSNPTAADIKVRFHRKTEAYSLGSFYAGAGNGYVPNYTIGYPGGNATYVPSSGAISMANFYGSPRQVVYVASVWQGLNNIFTMGPGTWYVYARLAGGGGGGGGSDAGNLGGAGGPGGSIKAKFTVSANNNQLFYLQSGMGGGAGRGNVQEGGGIGGVTYSTSDSLRIGGWYRQEFGADSIGNYNWRNSDPSSYRNVVVNVPTAGTYRLTVSSDDWYFKFFINDTDVYTKSTQTTGTYDFFLQGGLQRLGFWCDNATGGPTYVIFSVVRLSDSSILLNSRGLTAGGQNSGHLGYLNGGTGGGAGNVGTSGSGGGGGAASALFWNGSVSGNINNYVPLAIAPGGGGGGGNGRFTTFRTQYSGNWDGMRETTTDLSVVTAGNVGRSSWWFSRAEQDRVPYNVVATLSGQDLWNVYEFYPPDTNYGLVAWDGGGGGGAGAPNGYPGGYAEGNQGTWRVEDIAPKGSASSFAWLAPSESFGAGGNQGIFYYNSTYANSFLNSRFASSYYNIGVGGGGTAGLNGIAGAVAIRVSNIDDNIWPDTGPNLA